MDRAKVIEAVEAELRRQDVWVRSSSASVMVDGWLQLGELADAIIKALGPTEHEKAVAELLVKGNVMRELPSGRVVDDAVFRKAVELLVKHQVPMTATEVREGPVSAASSLMKDGPTARAISNASEPSGDDQG